MRQGIAKRFYLAGAKIRGEAINDYLIGLEKSQWFSPEILRQRQRENIKTLIDFAYQHSPFYKESFENIGITPKDIESFEDFLKIPILTKDKFRENIEKLFIARKGMRHSAVKTSGSTGISMKFCKDRVASGYARAAMYRGHRWYGVDIGAKEAKLWGIPVNYFDRLKCRIEDKLLNRFREDEYNLKDITLFNFYKKIIKLKPEYIFGYASMAYEFARFIKNQKLDGKKAQLKMIKTTSETLQDYQKDFIEKVFGCKVANEYGASETGLIGFTCPEGAMHIMDDCVYIEIVDDDGRTCPEGKTGRVIVTDLHNYSLPVIRYEVGDIASFSLDKCSCGRGLSLLKSVQGRSCDIVFASNGGKLHSIIFYYIAKGLSENGGGLKQFKVYQKSRNHIIMQIVKDEHFGNHTVQYLDNRIKGYLGNDCKIDYDYVELIPREPSGKLRDFVQEIRN